MRLRHTDSHVTLPAYATAIVSYTPTMPKIMLVLVMHYDRKKP
jgi:hypothetical protein